MGPTRALYVLSIVTLLTVSCMFITDRKLEIIGNNKARATTVLKERKQLTLTSVKPEAKKEIPNTETGRISIEQMQTQTVGMWESWYLKQDSWTKKKRKSTRSIR